MQVSQLITLLGLMTISFAAPAPGAEAEALPIAQPLEYQILAKRECSFTACKGYGKSQCAPTFTPGYGTCNNLISSDGRPFISGHSGSGCTCTIYSGGGCTGESTEVDSDGYSRFPFDAGSVACPSDV